mmetsp:Transcript_18518/g.46885  ORF Transcript_18518/g.46885 Transcript_18518/m.46885 type:complete len:83 (-) Transcript_18518:88-336(-)|eukprot:jgi/Tetstr1/430886/TSEL_020643.t1
MMTPDSRQPLGPMDQNQPEVATKSPDSLSSEGEEVEMPGLAVEGLKCKVFAPSNGIGLGSPSKDSPLCIVDGTSEPQQSLQT